MNCFFPNLSIHFWWCSWLYDSCGVIQGFSRDQKWELLEHKQGFNKDRIVWTEKDKAISEY
jgi:hypothetical protein